MTARQLYVSDGENWMPVGDPIDVPTVAFPSRVSVLRDGQLIETDGEMHMPADAVIDMVAAVASGAHREPQP